ncbi:MAG: hypothetical protein V1911_04190 [Candidatus Micrarchaeota archaeon]
MAKIKIDVGSLGITLMVAGVLCLLVKLLLQHLETIGIVFLAVGVLMILLNAVR